MGAGNAVHKAVQAQPSCSVFIFVTDMLTDTKKSRKAIGTGGQYVAVLLY